MPLAVSTSCTACSAGCARRSAVPGSTPEPEVEIGSTANVLYPPKFTAVLCSVRTFSDEQPVRPIIRMMVPAPTAGSARRTDLPLPEGEGRGEGELRAGVAIVL